MVVLIDFDKLVINGVSANNYIDFVQDDKRSSSWNIEHGYVETYTINQMSIASRSFRVVYQCYFQVFSTYSQSVRAKKRKRKEMGEKKSREQNVSTVIGEREQA